MKYIRVVLAMFAVGCLFYFAISEEPTQIEIAVHILILLIIIYLCIKSLKKRNL